MTILWFILGLAIVVVTMADLAFTTLTTRGAGPITSRLTEGLWKLLLRLHHRTPSHRLLAHGGTVMVTVIAATWVLGLWFGWALVFFGAEVPLVDASNQAPADAVERIYFAGYTLFTLGLGDFRPANDLWRIVTVFCAGNGLLAVTLAVTYLVPIISAATGKRTLAIFLGTLGASPHEILRSSWDGERFDLDGAAREAIPMIIDQGQQHLAYPALHYFHSPDPGSALPLRLAAFSEAVLILGQHVRPAHRPSALTLRRCSLAITSFLQALDHMHIEAASEAPPLPDLDQLRGEGLPVSAAASASDTLSLRDERARLLTLVESDGWHWSDLSGSPARSAG